jgi:hypothetical protein
MIKMFVGDEISSHATGKKARIALFLQLKNSLTNEICTGFLTMGSVFVPNDIVLRQGKIIGSVIVLRTGVRRDFAIVRLSGQVSVKNELPNGMTITPWSNDTEGTYDFALLRDGQFFNCVSMGIQSTLSATGRVFKNKLVCHFYTAQFFRLNR